MTKAVVTGGAGFIGSHLVDALLARGFDVHTIDDYAAGKRTDRMAEKAIHHEASITDYAAIAPVLSGAQYVFHLAALPRVQDSIDHPLETFAANVTGTLTLLQAAKEGKVGKVIFASSAATYGDLATMPLSENMPVQPKSPYGLHKKMGEDACRLWSDIYRLPTVSLRFFNVYGPRFDPQGAYALVVGKFLSLRKEGKPLSIAGDGSHTRDYVHVSDVVAALMAAAESSSGTGDVFNVATGKETSVKNLANLIGGPTESAPERLEPTRCVADISKTRDALRWEPKISLEDGIAALKAEMGIV